MTPKRLIKLRERINQLYSRDEYTTKAIAEPFNSESILPFQALVNLHPPFQSSEHPTPKLKLKRIKRFLFVESLFNFIKL